MFELSIKTKFEAAHRLPGYSGKCERLHGHNWVIEVIVNGSKLDKLGMLIDFGILKKSVADVTDKLDHYYLNEQEPFKEINPTAENIAKYIYVELKKMPIFSDSVSLKTVKVWESEMSAVSYMED